MTVIAMKIYHFQGSPETMEWWRSAAILLAQHHYTNTNVSCFVAGEGEERASPRHQMTATTPPPPRMTVRRYTQNYWGEPCTLQKSVCCVPSVAFSHKNSMPSTDPFYSVICHFASATVG